MDFGALVDSFRQLSNQLEGQVGIPVALVSILGLIGLDWLVLGRMSLFRSRFFGVLSFLLFLWLFLWFGPGAYQKYLSTYDLAKPVEIPIRIENTTELTTSPFPGGRVTEQSDGTRKRQKQAVVLCIDVSGSMGPNPLFGKSENQDPNWTTGNDPDRLALLAAHLLTDLSSENQQVGAVFFASKVVKVLPLAKIEANQLKSKLALKSGLDAVYQGGTDIPAGIAAAEQLLRGLDNSYGKYLIVLSDMEKDPKNKEVPLGTRERLHESGIESFSIGLGPKADLEQMSRVTWVEPFPVSEAGELPDVFKKILGKLWDTREVPQSQNENGDFLFQQFLPVAREVNFIVYDHDIENLELILLKPNGQPFSDQEFAARGNYRGGDRNYRAFKVGRPDQFGTGQWMLKVNRNPDQVSFMQVLDLAINAQFRFDFKKRQVAVENVRLVNITDGSPYDNPVIFSPDARFDLVMQPAGGKETSFPLTEKTPGSHNFVGQGEFDTPGSYQFSVRFQNTVTAIRSDVYTFAFTETNKVALAGKPGPIRLATGAAARLVFQPTSDSSIQSGRLKFVPDFSNVSQVGHGGTFVTVGPQDPKDVKDPLEIQARRFGLGQDASSGGEVTLPVSLHGEKQLDLPLSVDVDPSGADLVNMVLFLVFEAVCALLGLAALWKLLFGRYFHPRLRALRPQKYQNEVKLPNRWFWPQKSEFSRGSFSLVPTGAHTVKRTVKVRIPGERPETKVESLSVPRDSYVEDSYDTGTRDVEYALAMKGRGTKEFVDQLREKGNIVAGKSPF